MADSATDSGSNKWIYIGIGAVVLIGSGIGIYFMMNKSSSAASAPLGSPSPSPSLRDASVSAPATGGNDYVSGAAIAKRKGGNYEGWKDLGLNQANREKDKADPIQMDKWNQFDTFWGTVDSNFGNVAENSSVVSGFLKGMNLPIRKDSVLLFKQFIQEYIDNPVHKKDWEGVAQGEFLK